MAIRFDHASTAATPREAGGRAKGEFRCAECGYGVVVWDALPTCPMCQGEIWEPVPWRPFTRASNIAPLDDRDDLRDLPL